MFGFAAVVVVAVLGLQIALAEPKPYPRLQAEAWFSRYALEALASIQKFTQGADVEIWMTHDSFETVRAFYRPFGSESPAFAQPLIANLRARSGHDVKATYVTLDGAASPVESKRYVSIQRPIIVQFEPLEVHDVTQIVLYRMK
jgi:hypothetical protein